MQQNGGMCRVGINTAGNAVRGGNGLRINDAHVWELAHRVPRVGARAANEAQLACDAEAVRDDVDHRRREGALDEDKVDRKRGKRLVQD